MQLYRNVATRQEIRNRPRLGIRGPSSRWSVRDGDHRASLPFVPPRLPSALELSLSSALLTSHSAYRHINICHTSSQPLLPTALPTSSALRRVDICARGRIFCWLCLALAWYMPSSSTMLIRICTTRYFCPTSPLYNRHRSQYVSVTLVHLCSCSPLLSSTRTSYIHFYRPWTLLYWLRCECSSRTHVLLPSSHSSLCRPPPPTFPLTPVCPRPSTCPPFCIPAARLHPPLPRIAFH